MSLFWGAVGGALAWCLWKVIAYLIFEYRTQVPSPYGVLRAPKDAELRHARDVHPTTESEKIDADPEA